MNNLIANAKAALSVSLGRFFYAIFNTRPALKRACLVAVLYSVPTVLAALFSVAALVVGVWALMLLAVFWGMGAERAAIEWDKTFSLPPLSAFAFWRWHGLEKKRFIAVIVALSAMWLSTAAIQVLS